MWAHATNSRELLDAALSNERITFIETDLMCRTAEAASSSAELTADDVNMAHPPHRESNLTFRAFLSRVEDSGRSIGIKLDFKERRAVKPCIELLKERGWAGEGGASRQQPLWLNADILPGPGSSSPNAPTPLPAAEFVELCSRTCPRAVLSLGVTHGPPVPGKLGYSVACAEALLRVARSAHAPVTLALSAFHLFATAPKPRALILGALGERCSLTLWGECPSAAERWMRAAVVPELLYIDIKPARRSANTYASILAFLRAIPGLSFIL